MIHELNPDATVITTPVEALGGKKVLETMEGVKIDLSHAEEEHHHHEHECCCGHEHHHHDHEECCGHEHHHHDHEECCGHEHHHHDHEECCGHEHHHHHADEVFTSWGRETVHKYGMDEMKAILDALSEEESYGTVLRAKGMVESTDGTWIYFDMVPGEVDVRTGQPEYTGRICVIGAQLKEDKLEQLFQL